VGFTDPLVGEFMQGDARSGEVEVRPMADRPVTTVFVRQLGTDGTWWVLSSATANITADTPGAGDAISSPVVVRGSALAFEGTVTVEVRQDGTRQPLGSGVVTGGGDVARPFSGKIAFSAPSTPYGAVVSLTRSEADGRVWEAAVLRVSFASSMRWWAQIPGPGARWPVERPGSLHGTTSGHTRWPGRPGRHPRAMGTFVTGGFSSPAGRGARTSRMPSL
jgi:Immunoglobulin-like domain of bacterial spore germination